MKKVAVGDIVIYNTTAEERALMEKEYDNQAKQLPAMVVAVWGENCINVKVEVDGKSPAYWRTSIHQGDAEGEWQPKQDAVEATAAAIAPAPEAKLNDIDDSEKEVAQTANAVSEAPSPAAEGNVSEAPSPAAE